MVTSLSLEYDGVGYSHWSADALKAAGVPAAAVDAVALAQAQIDGLAAIDAAAATARSRYLTTAPGQSAVYARKLAEAQAYIAANSPSPADPAIFPILVAQAAAVGQAVAAVALAITAADVAWGVAAGKIEALRVPGKSAVRAATTAESSAETAAAAVSALAQI